MNYNGRRYKYLPKPTVEVKERSLEEIEAVIRENGRNPSAGTFDGLTSAEIAKRNRRVMFGANDEAFPSQEEWSRIVD